MKFIWLGYFHKFTHLTTGIRLFAEGQMFCRVFFSALGKKTFAECFIFDTRQRVSLPSAFFNIRQRAYLPSVKYITLGKELFTECFFQH
jgi:hypothetical protein